MLISSSKALFAASLVPAPCAAALQRRTFSCTCPLAWKRKSASTSTIPLKIKAKNLKSATERWTVLPGERFIRARAEMAHGMTRMDLRTKQSLRGYKLAEPEHLRQLKRLIPYYRKLIRREIED